MAEIQRGVDELGPNLELTKTRRAFLAAGLKASLAQVDELIVPPVAGVSVLKRELDREGQMIDSSTIEESRTRTERESSFLLDFTLIPTSCNVTSGAICHGRARFRVRR